MGREAVGRDLGQAHLHHLVKALRAGVGQEAHRHVQATGIASAASDCGRGSLAPCRTCTATVSDTTAALTAQEPLWCWPPPQLRP